MQTETVTEKSLRRNLYRVLRKTGVTRDNICLTASFYEDLNFDNIDWTIFIHYLERIFDIRIKDEELNSFANINDTLLYLRGELVYSHN